MSRNALKLVIYFLFLAFGLLLAGCPSDGIKDPVLVTIELEPASARIASGETVQFSATGTYDDQSQRDISASVAWSSSSEAVATLGSNGIATAVGEGQTLITASLNGVVSLAATLEVVSAANRIVSIAVDPSQVNLQIGAAQPLTATGTFLDGQTRDVTAEATWESSDASVASVSNSPVSKGQVVGVAAGSAMVTARLDDVSSAAAQVSVSAVSLVSLEVTPIGPSLPLGQRLQFTATGTFSDDSTANLTTLVAWTSSNPIVAAFSEQPGEQGIIIAGVEGTTRVGATFAGVTSTERSLTVSTSSLTELQIDPMSVSLAVGAEQVFAASGVFSDGQVLDLSDAVTWHSDDVSILVFDGQVAGRARALAQGNALVWASFSGIDSAQASVVVSSAVLEAIEVAPITPSLPVGQQLQFAATGHYSDQTTLDLTSSVVWSSDDFSVATVSNAVDSKGLATGLAEGLATIRAGLSGVEGVQPLSVQDIQIVSLDLEPDGISLPVGETHAYVATATYNNGTQAEVTQFVTWHVANPLVAEVSNLDGQRGVATGLGQGSTTLWATAANGVASGPVTLSVSSATLTSIVLDPPSASSVLGAQTAFTATGHYSDGNQLDLTDTVTWVSSDQSVASISNAAGSKGVATTLAVGFSLISAEKDGVSSSSARLDVVEASLESISLNPLDANVAVGETVQFVAFGHYSDGLDRDVTELCYWTSSDGLVAHLSNAVGTKGLATGLAEGSVSVAAAYQGVDSAPASLGISAPVNQQPLAVLSGDSAGTVGQLAAFSAAGSSDPDGTITNYIFDFGDGSQPVDNGNVADITYAYLAANTYTVTLTVRDDLGATGSAVHQIAVSAEPNEAPHAVLICPGSGQIGQSLEFDGANSYDSDGTIVNYTFNFGDGSGDQNNGMLPNLLHAFGSESVFTAYLTVTDDDGAQAQASCPVAIGAATVPEVRIIRPQGSLEVTQGQAVNVLVDANGQGGYNVTHVTLLADGLEQGQDDTAPFEFEYTIPAGAGTGSTIVLQARAYDDNDPAGMGQSGPVMLDVRNYVPVADFTATISDALQVTVDASACYDVETPLANLEVRFDWESDGTFDTAWDVQKIQTHDYALDGDYTITMEVRDATGQTDSTDRTVSLSSQQTVGGVISSTTWYGTVIMTGSVTVPAGEVLTINPGTQILVMYLDQNADGVGDFGLYVDGEIHANGTQQDPILFTMYGADHKDPGAWQGIVARGTAADFAWTVVEYADVGLFLQLAASVSDASFRFNRTIGLFLDDADGATLTRLSAHDNDGEGVVLQSADSVIISDLTSQNNLDTGLRLTSSNNGSLTTGIISGNQADGVQLIDSALAIDDCQVSQNGGYGLLYRGGSDGSLTHSVITYNDDVGIRAESTAGHPHPTINYNNIYGNSVVAGTVETIIDPSATLSVVGQYSSGNLYSGTWATPSGGLIRRAYFVFDDFYYADAFLETGAGANMYSRTSDFSGWVNLYSHATTDMRIRMYQTYNSNSNTSNDATVTQVEYASPEASGIEISVSVFSGTVDARYNYWGAFPNVLDHVHYGSAASLDLQGFVGVAFDDTWDLGPYKAGNLVSETWSGTIYVTGDVTIPAGETLTVDAGTQVQFVPLDQDYDGVGDYGLYVNGTLAVNGNGADRVAFTAHGAAPVSASFDRVRLAGDGSSSLAYADFSWGLVGLEVSDASSVSDSTFQNNSQLGLFLNDADGCSLDRLSVMNNEDIGMRVSNTSGASLDYLAVTDNTGVGLLAENSGTSALTDSTIQDNGGAGLVLDDTSWDISYCSVLYNGAEGINYLGTSSGTLSQSNIKYNSLPGLVIESRGSPYPQPNISYSNMFGNSVNNSLEATTVDPSASLSVVGQYSSGNLYSSSWSTPSGRNVIRAYFVFDDFYYADAFLETGSGTNIYSRTSDYSGWVDTDFAGTDDLRIRMYQTYNSNSNTSNDASVTSVEYLDTAANLIEMTAAVLGAGTMVQANHIYWGQSSDVFERISMVRPDSVDFTSWELSEVTGCGPR